MGMGQGDRHLILSMTFMTSTVDDGFFLGNKIVVDIFWRQPLPSTQG